MCTVSFVPISSNHFILTSNRDETVKRGLASSPQRLNRNGNKIICPVDPLASGSWIAASENGSIVCLLNGAFKKHKHLPPYRMSRGIVVLDSLIYKSSEEFAKQYSLDGIEPFTMVMIRNNREPSLHELRWDGKEKYFISLDQNAVHMWSSATLYSDELIAEKEKSFGEYLPPLELISVSTLIEIHTHFLYEDWVKAPARVEEVATLSITAVDCDRNSFTMNYRDLVRKDLPLTTMGFQVA